MVFDPVYFIYMLPALLLALWAQWLVKSTFSRFARVPVRSGLTGAQAAAELARRRNLGVRIEPHQGMLSDHYNPLTNTLALSPDVYGGRSVSSLGVAAHELGHAIQKADGYLPMHIRSGLVPIANLGAGVAPWMIMAGFLFQAGPLINLGILVFGGAVLFALVTLPVEFDASARAMRLLSSEGLVTAEEAAGVRKVLTAAALTYVAAAVTAVLQLLYYISLANRRE